jgi:abortive infection bacteriophage resistance protein
LHAQYWRVFLFSGEEEVKYSKPPLTFEQQADLLLKRGLAADKGILIDRLKAVSYYRLSGYLYPFRNPDNTSFRPGTTLEKVWQRYTFDRQLRLLVIDAIERVEVSVRTRLIYDFTRKHGPFAHTNPATLPKLSPQKHRDFLTKLETAIKLSRESVVEHFNRKYGDNHSHLPLWMAAEIMSLGMLLTFFRGIEQPIKRSIAGEYGVSDRVLESWLCALNIVRNICAHHGRLWNRELGYKPMIPRKRKHPQWHHPVSFDNRRVFAILTILKYMMNIIAPQSRWAERFRQLLAEYPEIPLLPMGFPKSWQDCPIWRK